MSGCWRRTRSWQRHWACIWEKRGGSPRLGDQQVCLCSGNTLAQGPGGRHLWNEWGVILSGDILFIYFFLSLFPYMDMDTLFILSTCTYLECTLLFLFVSFTIIDLNKSAWVSANPACAALLTGFVNMLIKQMTNNMTQLFVSISKQVPVPINMGLWDTKIIIISQLPIHSLKSVECTVQGTSL